MMKAGIVLMVIPAVIAVLWAVKSFVDVVISAIKEAIEGDKNDLIVLVVCTLIGMFALGLILCMSGSVG